MTHRTGFTLIELSIVLVIIGLIVGGVLVGRDLISASKVRSVISQIEKYNSAVNTFRVKYGYLPGDIPQSAVTQFGFTVVPTGRVGTAGRGDGNGIVQGFCFSCGGGMQNDAVIGGEPSWFWEDLSSNSRLIDATLNDATATATSNASFDPSITLPRAKTDPAHFISVYSSSGLSYFGLSAITQIDSNGAIYLANSSPGLSVMQAYSIDKKTDDGLPQKGNILALYQNWTLAASVGYQAVWAAGGGAIGTNSGSPLYGASTAATPASSTTCYDNGNVVGEQAYSIAQSGGAYTNCALSFKLQ